MRNLIMNVRRYKALICAVLPFLFVGFLLYFIEVAEGFEGIGYLMILIASFPVLAGVSILSAIFAFNGKDPKRKFIRTTKVLSVLSMLVFVGVCAVGIIGIITSMI